MTLFYVCLLILLGSALIGYCLGKCLEFCGRGETWDERPQVSVWVRRPDTDVPAELPEDVCNGQ